MVCNMAFSLYYIQSMMDMNILNELSTSRLTKLLLEFALIGALLLSIISTKKLNRQAKAKATTLQKLKCRPPIVDGSLPFIGHWWAIYKDRIGFLKYALKTYGPIFQLNLFRKKIIYICDRGLQDEFYNATEDKLSLTGILHDMKLDLLFMDKLTTYWPKINELVRKFISISFPKFNPMLKGGAEAAIKRLQDSMNLEVELIRFVITVPPKCIFNVSSSQALYDDYVKLRPLLKLIIFSSHALPDWFINPMIKYFGRAFMSWRRMGDEFLPEIQKYLQDPNYIESLFVRYLADEDFDGRNLNVHEIKALVLLLAHKNSENTINCLRNALIDLAENPEWWIKLREECQQFVHGNEIVDMKGLLQSKTLHATLMESARLNSNIVVSRRTTNPNSYIGNYYVGHVNDVVPCATFYMYESSYHKDSLKFNPNRYIVDKELHTPKYHTAWGSGVHQCPGKILVLNAIKMFVALVIVNFDIQLNPNVSTAKNYFTISPFVLRKLDAKLIKL